MTTQQIQLVRMYADIIAETVDEIGESGSPSGVVYAALMGHLSLDQYQAIVGSMVKVGRIRQSGDLLLPAVKS